MDYNTRVREISGDLVGEMIVNELAFPKSEQETARLIKMFEPLARYCVEKQAKAYEKGHKSGQIDIVSGIKSDLKEEMKALGFINN